MTLGCYECSGNVVCEDSYLHDGATVESYRCEECGAEGTLVHYPDGTIGGRGCLAEQANERIVTLTDGLRDLIGRLTGSMEGNR